MPSVHVCNGNIRDNHLNELKKAERLGKSVRWSINSKAKKGDIVVFYIVRPISQFIATGIVKSEPSPDGNRYPWPEKNMASIGSVRLLKEPVSYTRIKLGGKKYSPPQLSSEIRKEHQERFLELLDPLLAERLHLSNLLEEIAFELEGNPNLHSHIRYERNLRLREQKIEIAKKSGGLRCEACDLSFSEMYGKLGQDYIEVHHKEKLSEGIRRTALKDLALLCSNCHRMIHRTKNLEDIKGFRKKYVKQVWAY